MNNVMNESVVIASRPTGLPTQENFKIVQSAIPEPQKGEVLLKILFLSLDPYMRSRMNAGETYAKGTDIDGVMEGGTVAEVIESRHPDYVKGDIVLSHSGWQRYAISDGKNLRKLNPEVAPVSTALGVLGMTGFTAYAGLLNIGQPKPGETVVVAAASGAVGSMVGQIAKIKGARAVGIAGGPDKCAYVRDELGFDDVIDHRASDFPERLAKACPKGIDVYFENVGGAVWDAVFPLLNSHARIPVCGLISQYNKLNTKTEGHDNFPIFMQTILAKSLLVRGFIQWEFAAQRENFYEEAAAWIKNGQIQYREDIVDGLENAPNAFIGLLQGKNFGKLIVRVS